MICRDGKEQRSFTQKVAIPLTVVSGLFRSFLLGTRSSALRAQRAGGERTVCREDLNNPHTAVWGIFTILSRGCDFNFFVQSRGVPHRRIKLR